MSFDPVSSEQPERANRQGEIIIATLLWDKNKSTFAYSQCYDESWVEKLYRGFARNLSRPMRFICFTEKDRSFSEPIEQVRLERDQPDYSCCIEPYKLDKPMILVGLDTVITGNCDEHADYCFYGDRVAVPVDPFYPDKVCNGVALVPAGMKARMYDAFPGGNDMEWIRSQPVEKIDALFPGQVRSYKGHLKGKDIGETRIAYFHGELKAHELPHIGWIARHWV